MSERSQLERLARPIPAKFISPPPQGKHGDYVAHDIVTQILLGILGPFSFRVEQIVTNPDGLVDGCTASLTATVDGREVTVTEAGDCEFPENKKTQGDRLKNAASDALKRCAMRLGLGLHLWSKGDYFLYDGLLKLSSVDERTEGHQTSSVPPRENTGDVSPTDRPIIPEAPKVSPAQLARVNSKIVALQNDISVDALRKKHDLPPANKCDAIQLDALEAALDYEKDRLSAPFEKADA